MVGSSGIEDVHIWNGTLDIDNGTVNADVMIDNGVLRAHEGNNAVATIVGDLQMFGVQSKLEVDVTGNAANQHDSFVVTGDLAIDDGTLAFNFLGSAANLPTNGTNFDFFQFGNAFNFDPGHISLAAYNVDQDFKFAVSSDGDSLNFAALTDAKAGSGAVFLGGDQSDLFTGTGGSDAIYGGLGNDTLSSGGSGSGFDLIEGGSGADTLTGGTGVDHFGNALQSDNFHADVNGKVSTVATPAEIDQIDNFDATVDQVTFDASYFGHLLPAGSVGGDDNLVDGISFSKINTEYDGTNVAAGFNQNYDNQTDTFILDGNNNLIYDNNGSADGYTIVAHINPATGSPDIAAGNVHIVPAA